MEIRILSLAFFLLIILIRVLYYQWVYGAPYRLARRIRKSKVSYTKEVVPVSIVVYSKFGYEDIESIIPSLCNQEYPQYEVIFVLNEEYKLPIMVEQRLRATYSNLYFTYYPAYTQVQSRYKLALIIGLKAAKYDCILTTQCHCVPASNQWITKMARNRVPGVDIVVGVTQYKDLSKSKQSIDSWIGNLLRIRCYTSASLGIPFMGFGSNLMFSKSLYLQEHHIKSHLRLRHGEDDLFLNQCTSSSNTRMEFDHDSVTIADVSSKRSITTSFPNIYLDTRKYYRGLSHRIFVLERILNMLFVGSIIGYCISYYNDYCELGLLITATLLSVATELLIVKKNTEITHQTNYAFRGLLYRMMVPYLFKVQGKYKHKSTRYE